MAKAFQNNIKKVKEKNGETPYNTVFVKKILQGKTGFKNGKGRKVTIEEMEALWK